VNPITPDTLVPRLRDEAAESLVYKYHYRAKLYTAAADRLESLERELADALDGFANETTRRVALDTKIESLERAMREALRALDLGENPELYDIERIEEAEELLTSALENADGP
jgi:hypothetical protein